jgi:hypothetical protein
MFYDVSTSGVTRKTRVIGRSPNNFQKVIRRDTQRTVFIEHRCNSVFVFQSHSISAMTYYHNMWSFHFVHVSCLKYKDNSHTFLLYSVLVVLWIILEWELTFFLLQIIHQNAQILTIDINVSIIEKHEQNKTIWLEFEKSKLNI